MSQTTLAAKVQAEQDLDISIERVDKLKSPLLVIGLGGTGADVVKTIKKMFAERYTLPTDANGKPIPVPINTAYLVIDADITTQTPDLSATEYINISVPGMKAILNPSARDVNLKSYEREWINVNLDSASNGIGTGTNRQAARLMLSRSYSAVKSSITRALTNICTISAGNADHLGQVNIVIATGISGGTGSGTFLDVAQIVRKSMADDPSLSNKQFRIMAYIVMPDISLQVLSAGHPLAEVFKSNSYAALQELDFWMRVGEHHTHYSVQMGSGVETLEWSMPPFDACILMSGSNTDGVAFADAYNVARRTIAENLLHYLANENPEKNSQGQQQYSFISYEDNLEKAVLAMKKELPLHYGYRSIGAYTLRIPKKKLLYYEGQRLFDTFVPQRDSTGHLVPRDLRQGNQNKQALGIAGIVSDLYQAFTGQVMLPGFCSVRLGSDADIARMQGMGVAPHDCADRGTTPWKSSIVVPASNRLSDAYLAEAWKRFTDFSKSVITNPSYGPFSLMEYLKEDQDGTVIKALCELLENWKNSAKRFDMDIGAKYQACVSTWPTFKKPPLIGKSGALNAYLTNLTALYDGIRKMHFMYAYATRLEKLLHRIRDYRDYALKSLCRDIVEMQAEFGNADMGDRATAGEVFSFNDVKGRLDASFDANNVDAKVSRQFLSDICDASFATVENVDEHSSGVTFLFANVSMQSLRDKLRSNLQSCFGDVNSESLDAILQETAGDDPDRQQKEMDRLANILQTNSKPMFSQGNVRIADPVAEYSYLSVPGDAPKYLEHYKAMDKTQAKSSSIHDHLYCVTAWDGMALYRYSMLPDLKRAYYNELTKPELSMALHLVWNGDLSAPYTCNWTRLPSPYPYYFLDPQNGTPEETKAYEKTRDLVQRALKCGLLAIDDTVPAPTYALRFHFVDGTHVTAKSSEMLRQEVDEICSRKDAVTGNVLSADQQLPLLKQYLSPEDIITVGNNVSPLCLQAFLGLLNQPCNPFDNSVRSNPTDLDIAWKNHRTLSQALVTTLIATRPHEILLLEQQIEGAEYAQKRIDEILDIQNRWDLRIAYAPHVARFFEYGMLELGFDGYQYVNDSGEPVDVIQSQLKKADIEAIKERSLLLQCAAYLGDLHPDNEVRHALEVASQLKHEDLAARHKNKQVTAEELQQLLDNITALKAECEDSIKIIKSDKLKVNADVKLLTKEQQVLEGIQTTAASEENVLTRLKAALG